MYIYILFLLLWLLSETQSFFICKSNKKKDNMVDDKMIKW